MNPLPPDGQRRSRIARTERVVPEDDETQGSVSALDNAPNLSMIVCDVGTPQVSPTQHRQGTVVAVMRLAAFHVADSPAGGDTTYWMSPSVHPDGTLSAGNWQYATASVLLTRQARAELRRVLDEADTLEALGT